VQLLIPDDVLKEIFVRLPRKEFHQCRCLSRAWAAALSSDHLIDRHLYVRGKIRLGYDDLMKHFIFGCCIRHQTVAETDGESEGGGEISEQADINSKGDGEVSEQTEINREGGGEISEQEESSRSLKDEEDEEEDEDDDAEESDWREEYRTRGYVEVDND
jgi:hypothetical protein